MWPSAQLRARWSATSNDAAQVERTRWGPPVSFPVQDDEGLPYAAAATQGAPNREANPAPPPASVWLRLDFQGGGVP